MVALLSTLVFMVSPKNASALTADDVLNNMTQEQGTSYVNGVVEGLATARWYQDRPNDSGMNCIYDWYYQQPISDSWKQVLTWLERHPDKEVGALMYVLLNQKCRD